MSPSTDKDAETLAIYGRLIPADCKLEEAAIATVFKDYGSVVQIKLGPTAQMSTGDVSVWLDCADSTFKERILTNEDLVLTVNSEVRLRVWGDPVFYADPMRSHRPAHLARSGTKNVDILAPKRISLGTLVERETFYECWSCVTARIFVDYDGRQAVLVDFLHQKIYYRLEYQFKHVREAFRLQRQTHGDEVVYSLVISLNLPPFLKYSWRDRLMDRLHDGAHRDFHRLASPEVEGHLLYRLFDARYGATAKVKDILLQAPRSGEYLEHWYEFRFQSTDGQRSVEETQFLDTLNHLERFGLLANRNHYTNFKFIPHSDVPKPYDIIGSGLAFPVVFKLLGLISSKVFTRYAVDQELVDMLRDIKVEIAEGILENIASRKKRIWNPKEVLQEEFRNTMAVEDRILRIDKHSNNHMLIRRVVVTPTKVYYQGPQLELANRILRMNKSKQERFLRVTFCDDNLLPLKQRYASTLYARIESLLDAGVYIAGRKYEFLLYSNSSMKSAGCWFVAPNKAENFNADRIRGEMGDFSQVKNPATFGARMAQCFSSTTVIGRIRAPNVIFIDDVERNGYCFSDGVGRIGTTIARSAMIQMGKWMRLRKLGGFVSSAFQFRMAGAKGVLTLDPTIEKDKIMLRPSQTKFNSQHFAFEVVRNSFFSPAYLNHQYVLLLETLGVPQEVFLKLRDDSLAALDRALTNAADAMQILRENSSDESVAQTLLVMIQAGLFTAKEPYLVNMLRLFRALQLRDIKRRCKLLVKQGCCLLGVMDETGRLPANQIFCQYTDPESGTRRILKQRVAITRAPALHPGDIQVVEAVRIPELEHLCDVVVFSQHGERPLPNMLSGGDLDGDTFFVTWDERLIPPRTQEPMVYSTQPPGSHAKATLENVKRHFVTFLREDNLGQIDNAWKAWADQSGKGANCSEALTLAELHSHAVDFQKKGVPAHMPVELAPFKWPDFMEKPGKETYESQRSAGKIYRSVNVELALVKDFHVQPELIVDGWEKYADEALKTKRAYDKAIHGIMNQYDICSEFEVLSGFMFRTSEVGQRKANTELRDQIMHAVHTVKQHFRGVFGTWDSAEPELAPFSKPGLVVNNEVTLPQEVRQKASAWYMVAYGHPEAEAVADEASTQLTPPEQGTAASLVRATASTDATDKFTIESSDDPDELAAAERRRVHLAEAVDAKYQAIDWDMHGRMYSFPWVMYDVLCNIYFQAHGEAQDATTVEGMLRTPVGPLGRNTEGFMRPAGTEEFFENAAITNKAKAIQH
ncbi:RNA dependent RNA polymerase-domain-containing protein [Gaertneriomyces semiglobifer]|nr:RNA dependent RNA polymerase-domain-containing protein [Gaertneriomyces semiglobifer]